VLSSYDIYSPHYMTMACSNAKLLHTAMVPCGGLSPLYRRRISKLLTRSVM